MGKALLATLGLNDDINAAPGPLALNRDLASALLEREAARKAQIRLDIGLHSTIQAQGHVRDIGQFCGDAGATDNGRIVLFAPTDCTSRNVLNSHKDRQKRKTGDSGIGWRMGVVLSRLCLAGVTLSYTRAAAIARSHAVPILFTFLGT